MSTSNAPPKIESTSVSEVVSQKTEPSQEPPREKTTLADSLHRHMFTGAATLRPLVGDPGSKGSTPEGFLIPLAPSEGESKPVIRKKRPSRMFFLPCI